MVSKLIQWHPKLSKSSSQTLNLAGGYGEIKMREGLEDRLKSLGFHLVVVGVPTWDMDGGFPSSYQDS